MTEEETKVYNELRKEGYTVLHKGWPDFLAFKDGKLRFIEVKRSRQYGLSKDQKLMHDYLSLSGFPVEIIDFDSMSPIWISEDIGEELKKKAKGETRTIKAVAERIIRLGLLQEEKLNREVA